MEGIIRSFEKKEQKIYDSSTIINTDYDYEIRFPLALRNMVRGKKGVNTLIGNIYYRRRHRAQLST